MMDSIERERIKGLIGVVGFLAIVITPIVLAVSCEREKQTAKCEARGGAYHNGICFARGTVLFTGFDE